MLEHYREDVCEYRYTHTLSLSLSHTHTTHLHSPRALCHESRSTCAVLRMCVCVRACFSAFVSACVSACTHANHNVETCYTENTLRTR